MNSTPELRQPEHILIVEDDLFAQQLYLAFFQRFPVQTQVVGSVQELLQFLAQRSGVSFDLIILDQELPDGLGIEQLSSLRVHSPQAAVLMISGRDEPDFFVMAFNQGVDDYAVKPVNLELLWIKAINAFRRNCMQRQILLQQQELNQWYQAQQQELQLTEHLYQHFVSEIHHPFAGLHTLLKPSAVFSGDLILANKCPKGMHYLLLADATGHGLSAAVSLMPIMEQFHQGVSRSLPLPNLVQAMNTQLHRSLPADRFVAILMIRLDPVRQRLQAWNGGMPAGYLLSDQGRMMVKIESNSMALGILPPDRIRLQPQHFDASQFASLFFASDGLLETPMSNGQYATVEQLLPFFSESPALAIEKLGDWMTEQIFPRADDDVSCVLLDLAQLCHRHQPAHATTQQDQDAGMSNLPSVKSGLVRSHRLAISGLELRSFDLRAHLELSLAGIELDDALRQRVHLAAQELFLNALEHGILQLDSRLKETHGFNHYYELREQGLNQLQAIDQIVIELIWLPEHYLQLSMSDSGSGFPWQGRTAVPVNSCYGRGLELAEKLVDELSFNGAGNRVTLRWSLSAQDEVNR